MRLIKLLRIAIAFFLLMPHIFCLAQSNIKIAYPNKEYKVKDGYKGGFSFFIFQDKDGFLWTSSGNGLYRFDGLNFENLNHKYNLPIGYFPAIGSFQSNIVISAKSKIYFYDKQVDHFEPVDYPDSLNAGLMTFFYEHDNKLFIFNLLTKKGGPGSANIHLVFDLVNKKFYLISGLSKAIIMEVSDADRLIAFDYNGYVFEMGTDKIFRQTDKIANVLKGVVYTGRNEWTAFDEANQNFIKITRDQKGYSKSKICDWKESMFQSKNTLLLKDGSILFYSDGNTIYRLKGRKVEKIFFNGDNFFTLYQDIESNVWIGGLKGLYKIFISPFHVVQFESHKLFLPDKILAGHDHQIYMSVYDYGIIKVQDTITDMTYPVPMSYKRIYTYNSNFLPAALKLPGKKHLFVTDKGFLVQTEDSWKHIDMTYPVTLDALNNTDSSNVYFATNRGIEMWSETLDNTIVNCCKELEGVRVYKFYKDHYGNIWVITDKGTGIFKNNIFYKDSLLSAENVYAIVEDSCNTFWVSDAKGLFQLSKGKLVPQYPYIFNDGGPFEMLITKKNKLVMSKINSLYVIDLTKHYSDHINSLNIYNENNGFDPGEMARNCLTEDSSGRLWINGRGLIHYSIQEKLVDDKKISCRITSIIANNRSFNTSLESQSGNHKIVLNRGSNDLSFNFGGIALSNPGWFYYKYRLKGLSDKWSELTKETFASYYNLKPAAYQFEVCASTDGEAWSKSTISPQIVLPPFWYQTGYFKAGVLLAIVLLLYLLHRFRLKHLLRVEKLRNRISSDLHDEIGSTLSSINIYSGLAKKEANKDVYLESISQNVNEVVNKLDDLVWSINPKYDTLESIIYRLNTYAEPLVRAKGINLSVKLNEAVKLLKLPAEKKHHIFMILKELINNAVKHSRCNNINIKMEYFSKQLKYTVRDDGLGFDINKIRPDRNGLQNISKRIKEMKGTIHIRTSQSEGTEVAIQLPT